jgi:FkbM family methyltransferase
MKILRSIAAGGYALLSRLAPSCYRPYRVAGGRIYLDLTESRMMLDRVRGTYEVAKHKAVEAFVKPGGTFIDIGANKGDFTLLAARLAGAAGRVLAFEPEPTNCRWLRRSIDLNAYVNVALYEMALGDRDGPATLHIGEKSGWHTLIAGKPSRAHGTIDVTVRTLDSFLREIAFRSPVDAMKIDVEGAELMVLRGAAEMITASRRLVLLIDIHPELGVAPRDVCGWLSDRGFALFEDRPPFSTPVADLARTKSIVAVKS